MYFLSNSHIIDKRNNENIIPFINHPYIILFIINTLESFTKEGLLSIVLISVIIENLHKLLFTRVQQNSVKYNFLLIAHEYLFVLWLFGFYDCNRMPKQIKV